MIAGKCSYSLKYTSSNSQYVSDTFHQSFPRWNRNVDVNHHWTIPLNAVIKLFFYKASNLIQSDELIWRLLELHYDWWPIDYQISSGSNVDFPIWIKSNPNACSIHSIGMITHLTLAQFIASDSSKIMIIYHVSFVVIVVVVISQWLWLWFMTLINISPIFTISSGGKDRTASRVFILVLPRSHSWKNYAGTLSQSFS